MLKKNNRWRPRRRRWQFNGKTKKYPWNRIIFTCPKFIIRFLITLLCNLVFFLSLSPTFSWAHPPHPLTKSIRFDYHIFLPAKAAFRTNRYISSEVWQAQVKIPTLGCWLSGYSTDSHQSHEQILSCYQPHAHMFIHNLLPELLTDCLPSILYTSTHLHGLEGPNPKDKERRGAKKLLLDLLLFWQSTTVFVWIPFILWRWNPKNKHISSPLELSLSRSLSYETDTLALYPVIHSPWMNEFLRHGFRRQICECLTFTGRPSPVFSTSTQVQANVIPSIPLLNSLVLGSAHHRPKSSSLCASNGIFDDRPTGGSGAKASGTRVPNKTSSSEWVPSLLYTQCMGRRREWKYQWHNERAIKKYCHAKHTQSATKWRPEGRHNTCNTQNVLLSWWYFSGENHEGSERRWRSVLQENVFLFII